jgi:hypothetical protein
MTLTACIPVKRTLNTIMLYHFSIVILISAARLIDLYALVRGPGSKAQSQSTGPREAQPLPIYRRSEIVFIY